MIVKALVTLTDCYRSVRGIKQLSSDCYIGSHSMWRILKFHLREDIKTKKLFNSGIARITQKKKNPPPIRATLPTFSGRQKRRFARMAEKILMTIIIVAKIILIKILVILMIIMTKHCQRHNGPRHCFHNLNYLSSYKAGKFIRKENSTLYWFQIYPPDGATWKFKLNTPLVPILATRWHYQH